MDWCISSNVHKLFTEYDPNPLLTLEKKHRKRRQSSGVCTGDHEEPDCGESYCAKIAKMDDEAKAEEDDDDDDDDDTGSSHRPYKSLYWTWTGLGYKRSKAKKSRNKEFFKGIQRGDNEVINVGESAIFISHGNERPYIGTQLFIAIFQIIYANSCNTVVVPQTLTIYGSNLFLLHIYY